MKHLVASTAAVTIALAASSMAHAAEFVAEPVQRCYAERSTVDLLGEGFTPNARIDFSRDGTPLAVDPPIEADAAGQVSVLLTLRGVLDGQQVFTYVGTDSANPTNKAPIRLLTSAVDVDLKPEAGKPERVYTIRARGFFGGGNTLWAHIKRRPGRGVRNVKIGRIEKACKKVLAKKRLFPASAASGKYRVQFDTFRRFKRKREYTSIYNVTISRTVRPAFASLGATTSAWPWMQID
jgi:hypothetical protein